MIGRESERLFGRKTAFGHWLGFHPPANRNLGRCVPRNAPDAQPAGFTFVPRTELDAVLRRLGDESSTLRVVDVVADVADEPDTVAVVHDDVDGATLPELACGVALGGEAFFPSGISWSRSVPYELRRERARLDPTLVAHIVAPVARQLRAWFRDDFGPMRIFEHQTHVSFAGAVACSAFTLRAGAAVWSGPRSERASGPSLRAQVAARLAGDLSAIVLHAVLSPSERDRFIPVPWGTGPWSGRLPEDVLDALYRARPRYPYSPRPDFDDVVTALSEWQRSLPPLPPDVLSGLVAGMFPERVVREQRTRDELALLDDEAIARWSR